MLQAIHFSHSFRSSDLLCLDVTTSDLKPVRTEQIRGLSCSEFKS